MIGDRNCGKDRYWKPWSLDEVSVIHDGGGGKHNRLCEPTPNEYTAEQVCGEIRDVRGQDLLEYELVNQQLRQGIQQRPADPKDRSFVLQLHIPYYKLPE